MAPIKRLFRESASGRIVGVCAGIASFFDIDVALVRLGWVVFSIVPGCFVGGLVAYLAAWVIVPDSTIVEIGDAGARRLTRSVVDRRIAGVCGGLADYFTADPTWVRLIWAILTIVPGAIVLGVFAYAVAWFIMPVSHAPHVAAASPAT